MNTSSNTKKAIVARYRTAEKILEACTVSNSHPYFGFLTQAVHLRNLGYTLPDIAEEIGISFLEFLSRLDKITKESKQ